MGHIRITACTLSAQAACTVILALSCLEFSTPASADACDRTLKRFNAAIDQSNAYFKSAFKEAIGVWPVDYDFDKHDTADFCPKLLPVWRHRLELQEKNVVLYNEFHRACGSSARDVGPKTGHLAPDGAKRTKESIEACEAALSKK